MYISICPNMIYILYSRHIGRAKLVLFVNPIYLLVHGASVEPLVDWERHGMFYGLVEPPQCHVVFLKIWTIFHFHENVSKVLEQMPWKKKIPCHQCNMLFSLGGPSCNYVEANHPFSLAIGPNRMCEMLEFVITRCTSYPHFQVFSATSSSIYKLIHFIR